MAVAIAALLSALTAHAAEARTPPRSAGSVRVSVERRAYLMGTSCTISALAADRPSGLAAIGRAFEAIAATEALLSDWREDTALSRLNAAPLGTPQPVDADLLRNLERIQEVWKETGGAFDPSLGRLVQAWDLRGAGRVPTADELAEARRATGLHLLLIDPLHRFVVRLPPGPILDSGGFGKGEGVLRAAEALVAEGLSDWVIDFGGQVTTGPGGRGRAVAVADPRERLRPIGWIHLRDLTAATSADSERSLVVRGRRIGHILDPRVGGPAPDFGSVTVVSRDPWLADAMSTALFVMGPEEGLRLARRHPRLEALFLVRRQDGGVDARATPGMEALIISLDAGTDRRERTIPAGHSGEEP